jgi:methionyl aminopeptidase
MDLEIRDSYLKAGSIAAKAREYGKGLIVNGADILNVADKIEAKIKSLGGGLAFPTQMSCDQIAAHFCPEEKGEVIFDNHLVCLDVGVHVNGYIGDCACSVDLSGKYSELVKASESALKEATKILQIGTPVSLIGKTISETIESFGFKAVKNLSGHGLAHFNIHDKPSIPNYDSGDQFELQKGMAIAIEPFATNGVGLIEEKGAPSVFTLNSRKSVRVGFVKNIQKELEKFQGLPFTTRWLSSKFSYNQISYALNHLKSLGVLHSYPPLVEKSDGFVSQAENSFLIDDKIICTTKL